MEKTLCYPAKKALLWCTFFIIFATLLLQTVLLRFPRERSSPETHLPFSISHYMCLEVVNSIPSGNTTKECMPNLTKQYSSFNSHKNGSGHPTKKQMNSLDSNRILPQI